MRGLIETVRFVLGTLRDLYGLSFGDREAAHRRLAAEWLPDVGER